MCSNAGVSGGDRVGEELTGLLARLGELADADTTPGGGTTDAVRIDRIALLERVRAAAAAAQHTEMVGFARSQSEAQMADERVDPQKVGQGIADQIALACGVSPVVGSRRLEVARALWAALPETRRLLATGRISLDLAGKVVSETSHLDPEARRLVDQQLAGDGLDQMGRRAAEAAVKRRAYEVDRAGYTARARKARTDRRVTLRPAPDAMAWLTVLLPVEQGAACYAALSRHADTHVGHGHEPRTRQQVMTDTAVERLTGQAHAGDVNAEVNLVIPWDALRPDERGSPDEPGDEPGVAADRSGGPSATHEQRPAAMPELVGYGPIPMGIVRDILASSRGKLWWRRLFTAPATGPDAGPLIGGDPRRRRFEGFLAHLLGVRDHGRCRDPYCDAPIRHYDHIRPARAGGPTTLTNGRGACVRGNVVREMPDWHLEVLHDGLHGTPHTVRTTTPTGHTYTSRAGPAP